MQGEQSERLAAVVRHQFGRRGRATSIGLARSWAARSCSDKVWFFAAVAPMGLARQPARRLFQPAAGHRQFGGTDAVLSRAARHAIRQRVIRHQPPGSGLRLVSGPTRCGRRGKSPSGTEFGFFGDIQKSCRCTTGPFTGANAIESERGMGLVAFRRGAGHVDRAADQPLAARSRRCRGRRPTG